MSNNLKSNYSIYKQIESFFTGSHFQFDSKGEFVYCPFNEVVNKVRITDGQVCDRISTSNEEDYVLRISLTPDNSLLIIAHQSGLISKVGLPDNTLIRQFKSIHSAPIVYLQCNPTSTLLATGSSDGSIKLWNLVNHYCSHNFKGVTGVVSCIEFLDQELDDGKSVRNLLFAAAADDCIHVFDLQKSNRIAKLSTHCSTITSLCISKTQDQLLSCGRDKIAVVWDISPDNFGQTVRTIPIFESIESAVILRRKHIKPLLNKNLKSIEGFVFATIGEEGKIKIWDSKAGCKLFEQCNEPLSSDRAPSVQCFNLSYRPKTLQLCATSHERNLFFYELPNLELIQQLQGHIDEIFSACWFGKDNSHLAIASNSNDLKVIEVQSSKCYNHPGHSDIILCVKNSILNPYIVISSSKDCSILVWKFDPNDMKPTILFKGTGHTHSVHSLAIAHHSNIIYSGSEDHTLKKWLFSETENQHLNEKESGQIMVAAQTIKAHDNRIDALAISPNDELVVTGSRDKTAKVFSGFQQISILKGHKRGILAVQFSPVEEVVVTASGDATLKMWSITDSSCLKTFQGHNCSVLAFTFISEGLQLLSAASDGNIKIWNCKTNECTKTIDGHSGNIWTISSTQDDNKVVTAAQDGILKIWEDSTVKDQEMRIAKMQNLATQEQEFSNFVHKKQWRKAFAYALKLEDQKKTLKVIKEIMLDSDANKLLEKAIKSLDKLHLNFMIECCIDWASYAKNCVVSQTVFNIIVRSRDNAELLGLPGLVEKLAFFEQLTEKSFNRYEKLVQDATFVDFFMNSFKIR